MVATKTCPKCGAELPTDAPAGICPKCLMQAGLDTGVPQARAYFASEGPFSETPEVNYEPPRPEELVGLFPQFEILELLGHGGMGAVYKARQASLDRIVALKIIRPGLAKNPGFAERFSREAKALARLSHQSIVTVHDFGQADGLCYLVMEYVDGKSLRQILNAGLLEPPQALEIVPHLCDALQYAHDEGIIHRDIKPDNILIDKRGRVKIADFGLAKLMGGLSPDPTLTGTRQMMGTLHYMAPEQMQGARAVDHRADIYSLGVVFYEMLTGQLPIGRFEPPSKKVQVDVRLDEVALRSLESEPDRRYQHASEVKTDVEAVARGNASVSLSDRVDPAPSRREGLADRRAKRVQRVWQVIGALAGLMVVGSIVATSQIPEMAKVGLLTLGPLAVAGWLFVVLTKERSERRKETGTKSLVARTSHGLATNLVWIPLVAITLFAALVFRPINSSALPQDTKNLLAIASAGLALFIQFQLVRPRLRFHARPNDAEARCGANAPQEQRRRTVVRITTWGGLACVSLIVILCTAYLGYWNERYVETYVAHFAPKSGAFLDLALQLQDRVQGTPMQTSETPKSQELVIVVRTTKYPEHRLSVHFPGLWASWVPKGGGQLLSGTAEGPMLWDWFSSVAGVDPANKEARQDVEQLASLLEQWNSPEIEPGTDTLFRGSSSLHRAPEVLQGYQFRGTSLAAREHAGFLGEPPFVVLLFTALVGFAACVVAPAGPVLLNRLPGHSARDRVKWPAIGMQVAGVLAMVSLFFVPVGIRIDTLDRNELRDQAATIHLVADLYVLATYPLAALMILGALAMAQCRRRALAITGSIVSVLPWSWAWPIAIPIGIWALVALHSAGVKTAFALNATRKTPLRWSFKAALALLLAVQVGVVMAFLALHHGSTTEFEARIDAARSISTHNTRDEALTSVALDAATAGDADVVKQAIGWMTYVDARDDAASQCALKLAEVGQRSAADDVVRMISDIQKRDETLKQLAQVQ